MVKSFITDNVSVELRKKGKDVLRFDTKEVRAISAVEFKITRHRDSNYFVYNFMKNIHIVEHKICISHSHTKIYQRI